MNTKPLNHIEEELEKNMNNIEATISKYLGATCEANGKVFTIVELEYYPALEPEGSEIDTRASSERFKQNDIFIAGRERKYWTFCLVNIVTEEKGNDEYDKIENLLIRAIKDDNGDTLLNQNGTPGGPGSVYKYIFGEEVVAKDNNGQIKIIKEPESNLQMKSGKRKINNSSDNNNEPFKYNFYIEDEN